jgi:hypothetical protein
MWLSAAGVSVGSRTEALAQQDPLDVFASTFAASTQEFARSFFTQVQAIHEEEGDTLIGWRDETCGAVWAALQLSFIASSLSNTDREEFSGLVMSYLVPFWLTQCSSTSDVAGALAGKSRPYLRGQNAGNLLWNAHAIVTMLLERSNLARADRPNMGKTLATLLAHRMFVDVRRIEEFNTRKAGRER